MGGRFRSLGVGATVVLVLLAVAGPAPGSEGDGKVRYVTFAAEGANGYGIRFFARGSDRSRRAQIWVSKGRATAGLTTENGELVDVDIGKGGTTSIYQPTAVRSVGSHLAVPMGDLGRLSATMHADRVRTVRRPCVTFEIRAGDLVGHLRFAGERDYTGLDESRVRARVVVVDRRCRGRSARRVGASLSEAGRWRPPQLLACGPTPRLALVATRERFLSHFFAMNVARTEAARILRIASAFRLADAFTYRRDLTAAKLRPDPPFFAGNAKYADGSLDGDLRARFPGVGWTPVSPGEADLFRHRPEPLGCEKVFGALTGFVSSRASARVPAVPLRSRLEPPIG